jgi:hypothetical protein
MDWHRQNGVSVDADGTPPGRERRIVRFISRP